MKREQQLRKLVAEVTGRDTRGFGLDCDLGAELGLDSLAQLRLLAQVEKHFGVRFPDSRLSEFCTLRSVLTFMETTREEAP